MRGTNPLQAPSAAQIALASSTGTPVTQLPATNPREPLQQPTIGQQDVDGVEQELSIDSRSRGARRRRAQETSRADTSPRLVVLVDQPAVVLERRQITTTHPPGSSTTGTGTGGSPRRAEPMLMTPLSPPLHQRAAAASPPLAADGSSIGFQAWIQDVERSFTTVDASSFAADKSTRSSGSGGTGRAGSSLVVYNGNRTGMDHSLRSSFHEMSASGIGSGNSHPQVPSSRCSSLQLYTARSSQSRSSLASRFSGRSSASSAAVALRGAQSVQSESLEPAEDVAAVPFASSDLPSC